MCVQEKYIHTYIIHRGRQSVVSESDTEDDKEHIYERQCVSEFKCVV